MPPDLNSVPSSPRQSRASLSQLTSSASSRRPSHNMPPPAAPLPHQSPVLNSSNDQTAMPMRHPRPLTAVELHLELEKEQEAVVNRLTRELSTLRAQHSASVASNHSQTSTTSTPLIDPTDTTHHLTGPTHPTPSRRHRSSSSVSNRSSTSAPAPHQYQSQASADRAAAAGNAGNLSRQPSISAASGASTPARPSFDQSHASRPIIPSSTSSTFANIGTPTGMASISGSAPAPQWQEAERARSELEIVKAENEGLRQRIRSLERALRTRRESGSEPVAAASPSVAVGRTRDSSENRGLSTRTGGGFERVGAWAAGAGTGTSVAGPRERSESQSTTASSRRGHIEGVEDVVRVGESAGNAGLR